jgi:chitin disaccharide deacetylase
MQPNPTLKKLGFSNTDRVAIIHTDDIGMCQASVQAFADLNDFGLISSGAVMVPCPWFLEAAKYAREHPSADLGVHLTLTSEWDTYRWGPVSTRDPRSGLLDAEGCFYHSTEQAAEHGDAAAAQVETEAQLARALAAGMQPTHADTHMGTSVTSKFMPGYLATAVRLRLPPMVFRVDEKALRDYGMDAETAAAAARLMHLMEDLGLPVLDNLIGMPLDRPDDQLTTVKAIFAGLPMGITHFIIHPSVDSPELRAITPDWRARVGNYQLFLSDDMRQFLRQSGVQVIGYRALQQIMPEPAPVLEALKSLGQ